MDFLAYSAQEPMQRLRKKFNNGEEIVKAVPERVSIQAAVEDIYYVE